MSENKLPIDDFRAEIMDTLRKNPVLVLTAETGAGKSTRLPLWLWQKGKRVVVTQPRRIAARSLSYYLAQSNQKVWGKEIGYQTGFDRKFTRETSLLYLTDGVQMVKEIKGQRGYDVLVLDEIHEWNLNQEVLIGLVRKNLDKNFYRKTGKKVVVMSATLQAKQLSAFLDHAPIIEVPGRGFPVTMHQNDPVFLLSDAVQMVEMERNVLVFQPGKKEIDNFCDSLEETLKHDKLKAKILPLHSELSIKEQAKVFNHYPIPKVIVATDIAQTSLTIDDIDAVIDTGIKKEVRHIKGIEGLYPVDISHSECMQRAGRAGRVKSGQYILCAEAALNDREPYPEPEIRRLNLESAVLRLINWGICPIDFPYFHSPKKNLIYKAIKQLKIFGAVDDEEKITEDGKKMAELPVSIRSSRLLLESQKGSPSVIDAAMKLIAIIENKGILNKDYQGEKLENIPYNSDLLNQLFLWNTAKRNRKIISYKKLSMAKEVYRELRKRLKIDKEPPRLTGKDMPMLVRALLSTFIDAFYVKTGDLYCKDEEERQLDRTSVLYQNKPEMVVGFPFDLVVHGENPHTGEKERYYLQLLTFATEVTLKVLEELKPFSYTTEKEVKIGQTSITIEVKIHFGGKMVTTHKRPPNFKDPEEMEMIAPFVIQWYEKNKKNYKLEEQFTNLQQDFETLEPTLDETLKNFQYYRLNYLSRQIKHHLKGDDLQLFFQFHNDFEHITLKDLLPHPVIKKLREMNWPPEIPVGDTTLPVQYDKKGKPYLKPDLPLFEKMTRHHMILPTGLKVALILKRRRFFHWDDAVLWYNNWKRREVYETKWKDNKKPALMIDLVELPFPQPFIGGAGIEKEQFQYYSVPLIEDDNVFLIHFYEQEQAEAHFKSIQTQWKNKIQEHKRKKIEDIFKAKGWTVK
jgi:HrpA-like RNA helicase